VEHDYFFFSLSVCFCFSLCFRPLPPFRRSLLPSSFPTAHLAGFFFSCSLFHQQRPRSAFSIPPEKILDLSSLIITRLVRMYLSSLAFSSVPTLDIPIRLLDFCACSSQKDKLFSCYRLVSHAPFVFSFFPPPHSLPLLSGNPHF